jgi:hypothetical protein
MEKARKPSNSECYTPSSEPFRNHENLRIAGHQPRFQPGASILWRIDPLLDKDHEENNEYSSCYAIGE